MAVTSIWGVHGSVYTVTKYAANPVKTWNGEYGKAAAFHQHQGGVEKVMEYTADEMKTEKQLFCTGVNCSSDPATAAHQFYRTKDVFNKNGGIVCFHGYQSFKPGEVDAATAHKIGVELAKRVWGDKFEVLVTTHVNTGTYHNHIVLNSVSFNTGERYHGQQATYKVMKEVSDELCREYGLSVIENPEYKHTFRHVGVYNGEKNSAYSYSDMFRQGIDLVIASVPKDFDEFVELMRAKGFEMEKRGSNWRVRTEGGVKWRRINSLGDGYTEYEIKDRIWDQNTYPTDYQKYTIYKPTWYVPKSLYALFKHYCKILRDYPKVIPQSKEAKAALREDKLKVERLSREADILGRNNIETYEELRAHYGKIHDRCEALEKERKQLRVDKRRMSEEESKPVKEQIALLTKEIRKLYREMELCDEIAFRSAGIEAVVRMIEQPNDEREEKENTKQKEENKK